MRSRIIHRATAAAKAMGLARLVRAIVARFPRRFRVRLEGRIYDLRRRGGNLTGHVAGEQLEAQLRHALGKLQPLFGPGGAGDYLEFGVYGGGTMACFDRARRAAGLEPMRLVGFDSFQGLPPSAEAEEPDRWRTGMFRCSADEARETLRHAGVDLDQVRLVEGWFDETLTEQTRRGEGMENASVIMLDCDLYSSAKAALDFCTPLLNGAAVVVCDDWMHGGEDGERRAFQEFVADNRLAVEPLGHYRAGGFEDGGRLFLVTRG
jgi:O-methyltransferase